MFTRVATVCRLLLTGSFLFTPWVAATTTVTGSIPAEFSVSGGQASYSIPIQGAPGRGGMKPDLSINYSGGGNGVLGVGWSLGGLSAITRCPRTIVQDGAVGGINFDANDRYCLDGQSLIPVNGSNGGVGTEYKTEVNGYSHIKSYGGSTNNPDYWVAKTKAGQVITFGDDANSTSSASLTFPQATTSWTVKEINDTTGNNPITYTYSIDQNTQYLEEVSYTGGKVNLSYEVRPDVSDSYYAGQNITLEKRLNHVKAYHNAALTTEYGFNYITSGIRDRSVLSSVIQCNGDNQCLSPLHFSWSDIGSNSFEASGDWTSTTKDGVTVVGNADVDGDGLSDLVLQYDYSGTRYWPAYLSTGSSFELVSSAARTTTADVTVVGNADVNGDGLADLILQYDHSGKRRCQARLSTGSTFAVSDDWTSTSTANVSVVGMSDVNGDGLADLILQYDYNGTRYWPVYLSTVSSFELSGSAARTTTANVIVVGNADVNGDGLADLILQYDHSGKRRWQARLSTGSTFAA